MVLLSSCGSSAKNPETNVVSDSTKSMSDSIGKSDTTIMSDPVISKSYVELIQQSTNMQSKDKNFNHVKDSRKSGSVTGCAFIPKKMTDLTSGLQKLFYKYTAKSNYNLSLMGYGGGALSKKEVLLIVDFVQFKDVDCSGETIRFGVGARLFLKIKDNKSRIDITNLPKLAAAAEFGKAEVSYSISTLGIVGDKILDVLPTGSDFNVESYAKVVSAVDQIIRLAKDNSAGVQIDPQVIPVYEND